jgi:hypothetical protein
VAASAIHGAQWVDDTAAVELIWNNTRPPRGVVARNERIAEDELTLLDGLPVATVARTAFDLGRHFPRPKAIASLDALVRAQPFSAEDVLLLVKRYRGARGVRRLRDVLPLVDAGAQSPRESSLRLLLVDAGLPKPTTQIPVLDGCRLVALLDMGWEEFMVAVEYDGDQHRSNRAQYVKDIRRLEALESMGWIVIRVIAEHDTASVIDRVHRALASRESRSSKL